MSLLNRNTGNKLIKTPANYWPPGTIMAKRVKLVRVVSPSVY